MDLNIFDVVQSIAVNNLIGTQFFSSVANGALFKPAFESIDITLELYGL